MQKILLSIAILCITLISVAQSTWNRQNLSGIELQFLAEQAKTNGLPISIQHFPELEFKDSLPEIFSRTKFARKVFYEHLIFSEKKDYSVALNPALNFQYMKLPKGNGYINTRGFYIAGQIKNKLYFTTSFFENQGKFPAYMNNYAEKYGVLPGYSRMKPYKTSAWDYASAFGSIYFKPNQYFSFRIGHDKLFIGSGHRSLFLSDASFQQFFFQTSAQYKKFSFSNLSMQWINPNFNNIMQTEQGIVYQEGNYQRKFNSINVLTYSPTENIHLSFIEAVVFRTEKGNSPFNFNMINPFILARSLTVGFNSGNNLVCGFDVQYQTENQILYSQLLIDDWSIKDATFSNPKNRYAYQIGYLMRNAFTRNLNFRIEHNYVKALTYAHENPQVSYTHYNQNSTHPMGSNFAELLVQVQYRYKRMPVQVQMNYFRCGSDTTLSESLAPAGFNHTSAYISGEAENLVFANAEIGWYINPKWRLLAYAGASYRMDFTNNQIWFRFGLRTNLGRQIRDF